MYWAYAECPPTWLPSPYGIASAPGSLLGGSIAGEKKEGGGKETFPDRLGWARLHMALL